MRPEESFSSKKSEARKRRVNFDLYYYQLTNEGYSLRITPMGLVLILIALVIGFFILFSFAPPREKPSIDIRTPPPPTQSPTQGVINSSPSPPTSPSARKRPAAALTYPIVTSLIRRNTNGR
jgi:hypothetical protein